jgi:Trypsin-like peptidase domain/Tetratricopeptide repeat
MNQLENLLQLCTVKLTLSGGRGWGTGFFVAPGLILTCAHVVRRQVNEPVKIRWQNNENWAEASVENVLPDPYDISLLRVNLPIDGNHPCVFLDKMIESRDPLYLFGYPDEDFPNGCPATFNCEGLTGDEPALIKFALGQVRPGMSGSPLLNQRTGNVCGIVKFSRQRSSDLGGGALPSAAIMSQFPELIAQQKQFHHCDKRWVSLSAFENSNDQVMSQTNFDSTTNYQTKIGKDSKNYIGGIHHHYEDQSTIERKSRKILVLSSNPVNTELSRTRSGISKIRDALKRSKNGEIFDLQDRLETNAASISQELSEIEPYIVNISGCENGIESLIIGYDLEKTTEEIEALIGNLFLHYSENIKCIILNGCYLEKQAKKIIQHVEFVIGIRQECNVENSIFFTEEFYYQLGSGRGIESAYGIACNRLESSKKVEDIQIPILLNKIEEAKKVDLENKIISCDIEIEKNQSDAELWTRKAGLLKNLGRIDESVSAYEKASYLQPSNPNILTKQGDVLEEVGSHDRAVNLYDKALELEPSDYKIWWKKGKIYHEIKNYNEAVASYHKALELQPPSLDKYVIYREYGSVLESAGKYKESIVFYKKSLDSEPRYRVSSYEKKQAYKKKYYSEK